MSVKSEKEDIHTTRSKKAGAMGLLESVLRKYKLFAYYLCIVPLAAIFCLCVGFALLPAYFIFHYIQEHLWQATDLLSYVQVVGLLGLAFVGFCFCLLMIIPVFNFPLLFLVKPTRGLAYSLEVVPWMYHNSLTYLARYTVLEFFTPSPIAQIFYRAMGMKIGRGAIINTTNISDPCLVQIGDYAIIGGSAHIMAHYGMKGYLIIEPTIIGKAATIGLKASLMGDVHIGEAAVVSPHACCLPKTRVEANSTYPLVQTKTQTEGPALVETKKKTFIS